VRSRWPGRRCAPSGIDIVGGAVLGSLLLVSACSQVQAGDDALALAVRTQREALSLLERSRALAQRGERQLPEELAFKSDNLFATRFREAEGQLSEEQSARLRAEREEWEARMQQDTKRGSASHSR